jgi:hypothetical protein
MTDRSDEDKTGHDRLCSFCVVLYQFQYATHSVAWSTLVSCI